jgi:hypothetical protein
LFLDDASVPFPLLKGSLTSSILSKVSVQI